MFDCQDIQFLHNPFESTGTYVSHLSFCSAFWDLCISQICAAISFPSLMVPDVILSPKQASVAFCLVFGLVKTVMYIYNLHSLLIFTSIEMRKHCNSVVLLIFICRNIVIKLRISSSSKTNILGSVTPMSHQTYSVGFFVPTDV